MNKNLFTLFEVGLIVGLIGVVLYLGGVFDFNPNPQPTATPLATVPFLTPTPRLTPSPVPTLVAPPLVEPSGLIAFNTTGLGNQEIFTINVETGEKRNLTQNLADDYLLSWSPDGSKIAFFSTRTDWLELYVMNADGTDVTQLTYSRGTQTAYVSPVSWSPDGNFLIAARSSPWSLRQGQRPTYIDRIHADGSGVESLLGRPEEINQVSLSPDGQFIGMMFWGPEGYGTYIAQLINEGLTTPKFLMSCSIYSWIPTTSRISCNDGGNSIAVRNADGTSAEDYPVRQGSTSIFNVVWSPDGQLALLKTGYWQPTNAIGSSALSLLKPNHPPQLIEAVDSEDIDDTYDFVWASDNQWIAFTSNRLGEQDILIVNVYNAIDTRRLTTAVNGDSFWPQWQP